MIGLRWHHAEYQYVGQESLLDSKRQNGEVEMIGLQISLDSPTVEACGSFNLVVGRRKIDMFSLPKVVPTTECYEFEGSVVEERSEMVLGEILKQWSLRTENTEFYIHAAKLGASTMKLVIFETMEVERLQILTRVDGPVEFSNRFAPYSAHQFSWWTPRNEGAVDGRENR